MLFDIAVFAVGLVVLLGGGMLLLRGAREVALALGMSQVVVGATIVAFGTSAPELVVTVAAGWRGAEGVAFGNVVGSNIANVFLILGLAAAIHPIPVRERILRWEAPVLVVATAVVLVFALGGGLNPVEGGVMVAAFAAFLILPQLLPGIPGARGGGQDEPQGGRPDLRAASVLFVLGGLVALGSGSEMVVRSARAIATSVGVDGFLVGVVLVALGTSLPELVTTTMAAVRKEPDLAVGNIVGSNIFNLLAVAGAGSLVGGLPVDASLFTFELPVMAGSSVVLLLVVYTGSRVRRGEGWAFLGAYAVVLAVLFLRGG